MGLRWFKFRGGSCICCWGAGLWSGIGGYWKGWGTSWGAIWCGPLKEPWRGLKCWCFMEGGGWSIGLGTLLLFITFVVFLLINCGTFFVVYEIV